MPVNSAFMNKRAFQMNPHNADGRTDIRAA